MGCARCHDHKFDPIPTADYYAMAGIFKSTRTLFNYTDNVARWIDERLPLEGERAVHMEQALAAEADIKPRLSQKRAELALLTQDKANAPEPGLPKPSRLFPGIVIDENNAKVHGEWKFSQYSQNYIGEGYYHDGDSGKGQKSLSFLTKIPLSGHYEIRLAYPYEESNSTRTPVTVTHAGGESVVRVDQKVAPQIYGRFHSLGNFKLNSNTEYSVRIGNEDTDGQVVADAVQWILLEPETQIVDRESRLAALNKLIGSLNKRLKPITKTLKSWPLAMVVSEDPNPSDSAIRIRGEESRRGDIVPRGFLQVATHETSPVIPAGSSGRLELAEWIASPDNPLTSRVLANRIWAWLFGEGIVRSVDNLGSTGELPSHPELLDYLAIRIQDNDWSIKRTIREIMLSRAWRQSTVQSPEVLERDPDNRLLAVFPRRRLDAEQLRDAILAVNGQLDLTQYGPNIDGAQEINANSTAAQKVEYNYIFKDKRRSVYTPAFRVRRHELFDFGNVNFTLGQRPVTTVALQALYLLNDPFIVEQSTMAAERILQEIEDPTQRIEQAFIATLGRPPSETERTLVQNFLKSGQSSDSVAEWSSIYQSLFGSVDFRYLN